MKIRLLSLRKDGKIASFVKCELMIMMHVLYSTVHTCDLVKYIYSYTLKLFIVAYSGGCPLEIGYDGGALHQWSL
jgi:hypothetical protein